MQPNQGTREGHPVSSSDGHRPAGASRIVERAANAPAPMVSLSGVEKYFGGLHVLNTINLDVQRGEVVVGPRSDSDRCPTFAAARICPRQLASGSGDRVRRQLGLPRVALPQSVFGRQAPSGGTSHAAGLAIERAVSKGGPGRDQAPLARIPTNGAVGPTRSAWSTRTPNQRGHSHIHPRAHSSAATATNGPRRESVAAADTF
jgi:hypothetical protein